MLLARWIEGWNVRGNRQTYKSSIENIWKNKVPAWWLIPLNKWVITPVISGLTLLIPLPDISCWGFPQWLPLEWWKAAWFGVAASLHWWLQVPRRTTGYPVVGCLNLGIPKKNQKSGLPKKHVLWSCHLIIRTKNYLWICYSQRRAAICQAISNQLTWRHFFKNQRLTEVKSISLKQPCSFPVARLLWTAGAMGEPRVAAELVRPGVGGAQPHQRRHRVSRTIRAGPSRASPSRASPSRASPNRASPSTWNGAQSGVGGTSEGWDGADGWNGDQEHSCWIWMITY